MSHVHIPRPPAEDALPLDNLDARLMCADALFVDWPKAAAIVGNPPYQSKNKMQSSAPSRRSPTERYPDLPGRADYVSIGSGAARRTSYLLRLPHRMQRAE